jgi:hypothetical protein
MYDGYDSAERAWLEPPEPWGSDGEDEPLDPWGSDGEDEPEREITVKELIERMRKNAEKFHNNRPERREASRMAQAQAVGNRRQ